MDANKIIKDACEIYCKGELPTEIPVTLPLLDKYCKPHEISEPFSNMDVLFIQHHLGPFIPRLEKMIELGLNKSNCWFVNIPYSTNKTVCDILIKKFHRGQMAPPFNDPLEPYATKQKERVEEIIRKIFDQTENKRLLVIDDGAYFMRTINDLIANDKPFAKEFKKRSTFIVEQTTRGHNFLKNENTRNLLRHLKIPAVSIADTNTKSILESPFIGISVSRMLYKRIKKEGLKDLGKTLIIGYGKVGKATTSIVSKRNIVKPIDVYDIAWEKSVPNINDPKIRTLTDFPKKGNYNTVLGCTGKTSFKLENINILANNANLVSASSAAIEFNRQKIIEEANLYENDPFYVVNPKNTREQGIHTPIKLHHYGKSFTFLNAGFPINFDGKIESLPHKLIQVTHTLLMAGAIKTLQRAPGFHELSSRDDNWIYDEGLKEIKDWVDNKKQAN